MWLQKLLQNVLGFSPPQQEEEDEVCDCDDSEDGVELAVTDEAQENARMQELRDDCVALWADLFREINEYSPTEEQIEAQKIIVDYSFREFSDISSAVIDLVATCYGEDEIPEWLWGIVRATLINYISGNLALVQQVITSTTEG